ncbi:replication restart helicase PriA [Desulfovibrio oxyclinae]|uniref:replication restart helicase PriA n=1 Tax=Desulfovibrio oxyclinae TaxID=63560 RepID=UPI0003762508|nr:primosomal protein N' [Desulfovibrio oxyclinae]
MSGMWRVAIVSPPYQTLTYLAPERPGDVETGMRVIVPLGRMRRVGVVIGPQDEAPEGVKLRRIMWPLEICAMFTHDHLEMCASLGVRQMEPVGRILEASLPRGLRTADVVFRLDCGPGESFPASMRPGDLSGCSPSNKDRLAQMWREGRMRVRLDPKREAEERFARLAADPPWSVRPNAKRQLSVLEYLHDNGATSISWLKHSLGDGAPQAVRALAKSGLVSIGDDEPPEEAPLCAEPPKLHDPTPQQAEALERLIPALDTGGSHLLHGVTGSGKTLVYVNLIRSCLEKGRSALILAPEVAIACQLHRAVSDALPGVTVLYHHGYLSPSVRENIFRQAASAPGPVCVVGTRSSLFVPLRSLGLVVVDEEHDESYKQEERLAYNAKEVAHFLTSRSGALLVLGSATPDVKTFHAGDQGRIPVHSMADRAGAGELPAVQLVNIAGIKDPSVHFAPEVVEAMRETVEKGEQVIVMLNRRGYAPVMYCTDCAEAIRCPECEVGMTYHKGRERVLCHYCGLSLDYPLLCRNCGGANFIPMGEGTERLEEALEKALPEETGILRMDRDTVRRQDAMERILGQFRDGEAQVLVGTQMLSKGHDFPSVTLVVVVDGDLGLNLPDYRCTERTFQLLVQVSGRAGRGEKPGRVLIQTRNPEHPVWNEVVSADYHSFFEREIKRRKMFSYPPFANLGLIRMSYPDGWDQGPGALTAVSALIRERSVELGITALGPAPAPMGKLRGRKRFNCLLKGGTWQAMRELFAMVRSAARPHAEMRVSLDLDPVNML